jgi:acetolactate synthase-1/2/3 large subunit
MTKTGAQILWECLEREGVKHVFGYPGGAILPAYDALKDSSIHHVLVRHEQGATHMADGYARASGQVGVAVATSGPGATNMVTGIATAMLDSSPVVCITGQVGSKLIGSDAFQETDITGITLPVTKHNYLVTHADELARTLREAFYVARSGRPGPVLVDITKDAQQSSCEFDWEGAKPQLPGYRPDLSPAPEEYKQALELIHNAKRPVILAGHGIVLSGAMREVHDLVERAGIPVALTLLGLGAFPASHPLNLGMMGMHGEAWVNHAIQEADLLLALGMRFDDRVTGHLKTYAPSARKIHVEIDPTEINKNVKVDVALVGDLREVLQELLPHIESIDRSEWLDYIDGLKGDSAVRDIQNLPDSGHLYAAHVINDLWRETRGGHTVVVTDVGQHQMWEAQYYKHEEPRSLITSEG